MKDILTVGCMSDHGGVIITGDPTTTSNGKPVARIGDLHSCPQSYPGGAPHSVTPIVPGSGCQNRGTILGRPIAISGDKTGCGASLLPCPGAGQADC